MDTAIISIKRLISEEQCYETIRWSGKLRCQHCDSDNIIKRGRHSQQTARCRYECKACGKRFDDLTGTWRDIISRYRRGYYVVFHGVCLSNTQIAQELDFNKDDLPNMTTHLRDGIDKKKPRGVC